MEIIKTIRDYLSDFQESSMNVYDAIISNEESISKVKLYFKIILIIIVIRYAIMFVSKKKPLKSEWNLIKSEKKKDWVEIFYLPPILQISVRLLFTIIFLLSIFIIWELINSDGSITLNESIYSSAFLISIIIFFYILWNKNKFFGFSSEDKNDETSFFELSLRSKHDKVSFFDKYLVFTDFTLQAKYKIPYISIKKIYFIREIHISKRFLGNCFNISRIVADSEDIESKKLSSFSVWNLNRKEFDFHWWLELQEKFKKLFFGKVDIETIEYEKSSDQQLKRIKNYISNSK